MRMQYTTSMIIQESNRQRTNPDGPGPVVLWRQANRLAPQGLAEVDGVAPPPDLPIGAHLPHRHCDLVIRGGYATGVGTKRRTVPLGGRQLGQSLMWPLLVPGLREASKACCCLRRVA